MTAMGFRRREADRGAAAVEFALVTPLLLVMLFGIIDYGIWFADSISARQAVRNVARQGSVEQFGSCAGGATNELDNVACSVTSQMDQISGTTAVKVSVALTPTSVSGAPWKAGATLRICTMTKHDALLPLVPFPNNGITYTRVDMPIETAVGTGTRTTHTDPEPPGGSWTLGSWCP